MTYQRIEGPGDLPPAGVLNARAREKQDLDFKSFADSGKMWEHAKDIAAFSNALGGVLLVGADNTTDPTILAYPGVVGQTIADVARIYEQAGAMCSPAQNVDVVPIKGPGGIDIVAVNVDPSVHQVVASPGGQRSGWRDSQRLWRFPIRRGSLTDDIPPENLAMYMNQQVRRAYLMLASIPSAARQQANFYHPKLVDASIGRMDTRMTDLCIEEVPRERNFLVVSRDSLSCRIPLADVIDVWEEDQGTWAVKVAGILDFAKAPPHLRYRPRF